MKKTLLFFDRPRHFKDADISRSLRDQAGEVEECHEDIPALKRILGQRRIDALVVLTQDRLSPAFEDFICRSRNHVNLHGAPLVVNHSHCDAREAQRTLMLGASHLLVGALDIPFLAKLLKSDLFHDPLDREPEFEHFQAPVACEIRTFGRIGKIEKEAAGGNIFVETSLDLQAGDLIQLDHPIARELSGDTATYRVLGKTADGLYYRYAYQYHLAWQTGEAQRKAFGAWLARPPENFAVPKLKILFVTADPPPILPEVNTQLFSAYQVPESQLTQKFLDRMLPQAVISFSLSEPCLQILRHWAAARPAGSVLLDSLPPDESGDESRAWKTEVLPQLESFVRSNFIAATRQFYFLSRNSTYSRVSALFEAEIWALSRHHLVLRSPVRCAPGAVLQLQLAGSKAAEPENVYLHVVEASELADGRARLVCVICHMSPQNRAQLLEGRSRWRAHIPDSLPEPAIDTPPARPPFLDRVIHVRVSTLVAVAAALALVIAGFGLLRWAGPPESRIGDPKAEDGPKLDPNYDRFQKSVKKAFKLPADSK